MGHVEGQDRVDWEPCGSALLDVALHRQPLLGEGLAKGDRCHMGDTRGEGGKLEEELEELVTQAILLYRREHIDREGLRNRALGVVERRNAAEVVVGEGGYIGDPLGVDHPDEGAV